MPEYAPELERSGGLDTRERLEPPPMFRVLMHNDHYTTMEFVVEVLRSIFRKKEEDAVRIMLNIHQNGLGVCGVYTCDIAETKMLAVHARARDAGFPLRCTMEPA